MCDVPVRLRLSGIVTLLVLALLPAIPQSAFAKTKSVTRNQQTILITTKENATGDQVRNTITRGGCRIVQEIRCKQGRFSILEVMPSKSDRRTALRRIREAADLNIESSELTFPSIRTLCTPSIDDPEFPGQTHLQTIKFSEANCLMHAVGLTQTQQPRITSIDSGCSLITTNNEMNDIQQFNFFNGAQGTSEPVTDSDYHGTATTAIVAARTNNSTGLAGIASFDKPVKVTMCRVGDGPGGISTIDVLRAMTWAIDHQDVRGGPGVINIEVQGYIPYTYNASPTVQMIAKVAKKQGDLFVNAAGNEGKADTSKGKLLRRVAALDTATNLRASFSNFGSFNAAAPGTAIKTYNTTTADSGIFGTGTSFAAPIWVGAIALLMSINPKLNAIDADKIIFKTGTVTEEGYVVPNLYQAIIKGFKIKELP